MIESRHSAHVPSDDERLGHLLRAIRRRTGRTQADVASAAGVPVRDLIVVEAGRAGTVRLERMRRIFDAVGGQARLTAWWNGALADRLLDESHAALVERAMVVMKRRGWDAVPEVSFAEYGERGSIDIFAAHASCSVVVVCEIKTAIGSLEQTNRMLDVKERLAPKLAARRWGWRPAHTGRLIVLPSESTARRAVARHAATMDRLYPARSREIRSWLRRPQGPLQGIWFLSHPRDTPPVAR
jgi:hypothetical protein